MTIYDKIREYRELCGVTKKEVKTLGNFEHSEQYYGQCENGKYPLDDELIKKMYNAINVARAVKMRQSEPTP
ncbi:MAG: helix-turn-helix transcriptional regulator [Firmicutes bacterium]|nr:helix-turn-helix transcriptional regulator [Bacillota bacterium]